MSAFLLRHGVTVPSQYATLWPLTENPISEGGRWRTAVNFYKAPQSTPGRCFSNGATDNFDDALAQLISPDLGDNYEITAGVFRQGGYTPVGDASHEVGLYGRLLIDNSNPSNTLVRGYEMLFPFNSSSFQMVAWLGVNHSFPDNFTILSPTILNGGLQPVQNGDILKARFLGNVITVFQNGLAIATLTDTTWPTGGGPGFGFFPRTGATPSSYCLTDWAATRL